MSIQGVGITLNKTCEKQKPENQRQKPPIIIIIIIGDLV